MRAASYSQIWLRFARMLRTFLTHESNALPMNSPVDTLVPLPA